MTKLEMTKEECLALARHEGDSEVGAGALAMTVPQKRPFEEHPALAASIRSTWGKIYENGLTLEVWNAMLAEIDQALVIERNEAYVRGMHDEHNEPLGDRLPPLPAKRT